MTTPSPLQTLRDALGEANSALGWASSMLIEGVEFYTVREVLHAAQKDALKCHQAITRAEAALRELEAEPRYTVEEVAEAIGCRYQPWVDDTKRRLAERGKSTD